MGLRIWRVWGFAFRASSLGFVLAETEQQKTGPSGGPGRVLGFRVSGETTKTSTRRRSSHDSGLKA